MHVSDILVPGGLSLTGSTLIQIVVYLIGLAVILVRQQEQLKSSDRRHDENKRIQDGRHEENQDALQSIQKEAKLDRSSLHSRIDEMIEVQAKTTSIQCEVSENLRGFIKLEDERHERLDNSVDELKGDIRRQGAGQHGMSIQLTEVSTKLNMMGKT